MSLGDALLQRGLAADARRIYLAAAEDATSEAERDLAIDAASTIATVYLRDGRWRGRVLGLIRGGVESGITLVESGITAVVLSVVLTSLYFVAIRPGLGRVEAFRKHRSNQVVVREFEDGTMTGLGRGLPQLIATVYREQEERGSVPAGSSVLVPYGIAGQLPVLADRPASADFSWLSLNVAGVPIKDFLGPAWRSWQAPWSTVSGTIYRIDQDTRVAVSVATYAEKPVRWDSSLGEGVHPPRDVAYHVIFTLLRTGSRMRDFWKGCVCSTRKEFEEALNQMKLATEHPSEMTAKTLGKLREKIIKAQSESTR